LTPVPGGVGPVTTALLLQHTVKAAASQLAD
jgi:methylenetetrahydrofolate dehydrogenase (NADP+)/methenyltetrahydrofolate cyclohydrolase